MRDICDERAGNRANLIVADKKGRRVAWRISLPWLRGYSRSGSCTRPIEPAVEVTVTNLVIKYAYQLPATGWHEFALATAPIVWRKRQSPLS
jgi:hypothetical protein